LRRHLVVQQARRLSLRNTTCEKETRHEYTVSSLLIHSDNENISRDTGTQGCEVNRHSSRVTTISISAGKSSVRIDQTSHGGICRDQHHTFLRHGMQFRCGCGSVTDGSTGILRRSTVCEIANRSAFWVAGRDSSNGVNTTNAQRVGIRCLIAVDKDFFSVLRHRHLGPLDHPCQMPWACSS